MTVLLGLGIYALIGAGYVLFWALVLTCLVIRQSYRGARWLYRRHQEKKGVTTQGSTRELPPQPYMSEYHGRHGS